MAELLMATTTELEFIAALARRYIRTYQAIRGASDAALLDAICECDYALHDLTVALNGQCDCDPGTCPGIPS
jgi:hypothetical protein